MTDGAYRIKKLIIFVICRFYLWFGQNHNSHDIELTFDILQGEFYP